MTTIKQFIFGKTRRSSQRFDTVSKNDNVTRRGSEKLLENEFVKQRSSLSKRFSVHSVLTNDDHIRDLKALRRRSCDPTTGQMTCEYTLKRNQSIDSTAFNKIKGKTGTISGNLKKVRTLRDRCGDGLMKTFKLNISKMNKGSYTSTSMRLNESTPCLPTEENFNSHKLPIRNIDEWHYDDSDTEEIQHKVENVPKVTFMNESSSESSCDEISTLNTKNTDNNNVKEYNFTYDSNSQLYADCVSNELYNHHLIIIKNRIENLQKSKPINEQFANILKVVLENMLNLIDFKNIELGRWVGEGQYGRIYEAYYNKQKVVVKIPKSAHSMSASLNEAKSMNGLTHKNIVNYVGVTVINDQLCVLLEKIPKGNLRDYIRRYKSSVSIKEFFYYACDICSALAYLNEVNIVHRDVAARNVFVMDKQYVKLGDFGLAIGAGDSGLQHPLPVRWTAPESLSSKIFSHKSDVWSFGIFMWELFTYGSLPFAEYSTQHVIKLIKSGVTLPCPGMCPNDLFKILQWTWKKAPSERPSASALLTRLRKQKELFASVNHLYSSAPIRMRYKYSDTNKLHLKDKVALPTLDNRQPKGRNSIFHKVFMRNASVDKNHIK